MKFALLISPLYERICYEDYQKLAINELKVLTDFSVEDIKFEFIADVLYLTFTMPNFTSSVFENISRASFFFAMYEVKEDSLYPIKRSFSPYLPQSLSAMMKYTGKTNELFTRLLINLAYISMDKVNVKRNVRLLDPVAGKGTTLYEAMSFGFDGYGLEIGEKPSMESYMFIKKFIEKLKIKHSPRTERISGENKSFYGKTHKLTVFKDKDKGELDHIFNILNVSSEFADQVFKTEFFDMIVGDLPYGIQHGNVTNEKQTNITRSPEMLLKKYLRTWVRVLKFGGTVALSWNSNVLSREKAIQIVQYAGLKIVDFNNLDFSHRVDNAIYRNLIVAKKIRKEPK